LSTGQEARDNRLIGPLGAQFGAVHRSWAPLVDKWRDSAAGRSLSTFVDRRLAQAAVIYPARPLRALELTALPATRAVILGQDPYHGAGQAEGLAFSVPPGVRAPPSLRNIHKELQRDLGLAAPAGGSLRPWAQQGVLLLNTTLTVEDGLPASHARRGWEVLTDLIIGQVAEEPQPKVFMLWGTHAQAKRVLVEAVCGAMGSAARHLVLQCNHPSPLSAMRGPAPFIGCGHFSRASEFLARHGRPVDWCLDASPAPAEDHSSRQS
jgi:uracil-DNA glycosylase